MTISIGEVVRRLKRGPSERAASALKEWRGHQGHSQEEAAARLGVSLRTLQGWEGGRSMPYPDLLQTALDARAPDKYGLVQAEFPREFAEFVNFIGAQEIQNLVERAVRKLRRLSTPGRALFGDRFYFHSQLLEFSDGSRPFLLDVENLNAVRAASLIGGINRIGRSQNPKKATRLRAMVLAGLKPDRDIRQLEHEVRCATHFNRKGFSVSFADLEEFGRFDLLVETPATAFEVECKTVTDDTGKQLKTELVAELTELFHGTALKRTLAASSGLFTLQLKTSAAECKNLAHRVEQVLSSESRHEHVEEEFSLQFAPNPKWQDLFDAKRALDVFQEIQGPEFGNDVRCAVRCDQMILALAVRPHKSTTLRERIVDVVKEASDQCSTTRPSMVWLHFVGMAEHEFLSLAKLSSDGRGLGLNAIVAEALQPIGRGRDRSHVQRVRFSATPNSLNRHSGVDPTLLIRPAVSADGIAYDVPLPRSRFADLGGV